MGLLRFLSGAAVPPGTAWAAQADELLREIQ